LHQFNPLDAAPQSVVAELDNQRDNSIRRALLLILGEFSEQRLPTAEREQLTPRLLDLYANDPDPGIHGAAAWTLGQWGLQPECRKIDQACATGRADGGRGWFVSRLGKTLAVIPAPGEFVVGSPPWESGREGGPEGGVEMQRHVQIDHSFALMSYQVTVGKFLRFAGKDFFYRKYFSPQADCPINNVTWYDAVAYCNWLNEQEGIPQDQWCYLPNEKGEYAQGMSIVPNALQRAGYRLPTEAEWEFACRAGSVTSRYFGQSLDLVNRYSCNVMNSLGRRTALVGSFKPNELGLFDMLGNTLEWTHSLFFDYSQNVESRLRAGSEVPEVLSDRQRRALRGATLAHPPETIRAAFVDAYPPGVSTYGVSLRLARTSSSDEQSKGGLNIRNDHRFEVRGMGCFSAADLGRTSYRTSYNPNFPLFAFGIRTARTLKPQDSQASPP
jgi:formylglycine-generating enzyme required for sulfatase activity